MESIIRDLVEVSIGMTREKMRREVHAKAELQAEERVIDALVGDTASGDTRQKFRKMLREGTLADREIEIEVSAGGPSLPTMDIPGMPGAQMGMLDLSDMLGKAFGGQKKKRRMSLNKRGIKSFAGREPAKIELRVFRYPKKSAGLALLVFV